MDKYSKDLVETEVGIRLNFFVPGKISKKHLIEWVRYNTGQTGVLSASNPLKDIEWKQLSEMEEFLFEAKVD